MNFSQIQIEKNVHIFRELASCDFDVLIRFIDADKIVNKDSDRIKFVDRARERKNLVLCKLVLTKRIWATDLTDNGTSMEKNTKLSFGMMSEIECFYTEM